MAEASCPFCSGKVDPDLIVFPGEEAATDPGAAAQAREVEAQKVAEKKQSTRVGLVVALVALVGIGVGGIAYKMHLDEEARKQAILSFEFEEEEMFVIDVSDLPKGGDAQAQADAVADAGAAQDSSRRASAAAASKGGSTTAADPSWSSDRFADAGGDADASSDEVKKAEVGGLPQRKGITIGGGPSTSVASRGAALTDPGQIQEMAKRVMKANGGQLKACYEQRLKADESVRGAWTVTFTINTDGATSGVKVQPRNKADEELQACMGRKVEGWTFQRISEPMAIGKTYRFGSSF
jgi:outer membrane biosynthesis protein TonB